MREIKSNIEVEILNFEECFIFNLFRGKNGKLVEIVLLESEVVE